ncbi:MAG: Holliday junction branch migration protein RuvA [Solitalea sp.]
MIAYIQGELNFLGPTYVVIEAGGLGYHIHISLHTYSELVNARKEPGAHVRLFTYLHIKEDAHTLYGFASEEERRLFSHLISVSGIGPSTGRMILSSIAPSEMEEAIINGNVNLIKSVKGIGPKSAQRIILELQDKLKKEGRSSLIQTPVNATAREEALSALLMLGFTRNAVEKALNTVMKEAGDAPVELIIKNALKLL